MCFGDWSRQDFISNAELVEFLKDSGKGDENAEDDDDIILIDDDLMY